MNHRTRILLITTPLLLTACVSTTKWSEEPPPVEVPDQFTQLPPESLDIQDSLLDLFQTPELERVVNAALENNPNLLRVGARLEELGFNLTQTRSSLFPRLAGSAAAVRSDPVGSGPSTTYSADLDASWEVDIWGKLRASLNASRSELAAAEGDFEAARQSLVAQAMQAWFRLVSTQKLLDLDQRRVASFESTEQLVSRRFDLGEATYSQLNLARTDLNNARADLEASKDARDQAARQLQTLLGEYPRSEYPSALDWPTLDKSVPTDLPSDLLLARPDIQAAFERIRAADARVTVSQRELFPSFRLTASGGRSSPELSDLSDSAFNSWNALANVAVTLFDAGNRRASIKAADKRAEQAYYNYQSVVLNALREVENAIGSEYYLAQEESARLAALESANRSLERAQREYESGLTTILSLLETQRRVFATERQTINLRAARLNNRVSLALALGKAS